MLFSAQLMELANSGRAPLISERGLCKADLHTLDSAIPEAARAAAHEARFHPGETSHQDRLALLVQARAEIVAFMAEPIWQ